MDRDEDQRVLTAILGRLEEQSAVLKGITHEIAEVRGAVTKLQGQVGALRRDVTQLQADLSEFKAEMYAFRQETARRFDQMDTKLEWLTAKVIEHDQVLYSMSRKQA